LAADSLEHEANGAIRCRSLDALEINAPLLSWFAGVRMPVRARAKVVGDIAGFSLPVLP
jgi:hypothetical protein